MHSVKRMGWKKAYGVVTPLFTPAPKAASSLKAITRIETPGISWRSLCLVAFNAFKETEPKQCLNRCLGLYSHKWTLSLACCSFLIMVKVYGFKLLQLSQQRTKTFWQKAFAFWSHCCFNELTLHIGLKVEVKVLCTVANGFAYREKNGWRCLCLLIFTINSLTIHFLFLLEVSASIMIFYEFIRMNEFVASAEAVVQWYS